MTELTKAGVLLIGLGYKARQGKDTFARMFQSNDPVNIALYSFSSDVIAPAARWLGLMEQDKRPEVMQNLAETWISADPYHIIKIMEWLILDEPAPIVVIPGIRDREQAAWVKENHGLMVEIKRILPNGVQYIATDRPDHVSEHKLDDYVFDYTISVPDGDLEQMELDANEIFKQILNRMGK